MHARYLALAMVVLMTGSLAGQDSASAEKAYRAAIEKAEKDRTAATAEYVRVLKQMVAAETKEGDLDKALTIRDQLKSVEALNEAGGSLLTKLAGTSWVTDKEATFEWKKDGTLLHKGGVRSFIPAGATRVVIFFDNKRVDVLEFDKEFTKFEHWQLSSPPKPVEVGKRSGK